MSDHPSIYIYIFIYIYLIYQPANQRPSAADVEIFPLLSGFFFSLAPFCFVFNFVSIQIFSIVCGSIIFFFAF